MATKKRKPDMKKLAKLGGAATLAKYGRNHYSKIVKKRWANVRKQQAAKSV